MKIIETVDVPRYVVQVESKVHDGWRDTRAFPSEIDAVTFARDLAGRICERTRVEDRGADQ